ncbi:MAG: tRNA pseudouridine(55) synthase TruB [Thermodesulfobacteriota bacterium]
MTGISQPAPPDGVIVVDKPADITSARVVSVVKRYTGARKIGHAGTLDPFATGVLICLVNRATRLAEFFLHGDKHYEAVLRLGVETDTQDFTGTVISARDLATGAFSENDILRVIRTFEGEGWQTPPGFSAVKHQGVPLYRLARKGIHVEKPPRRVFISSLTVREIAVPMVRFDVTCSGGTYIRTLCADIGRALGCGGHLAGLKRTRAGGFDLSRAVSLDRLDTLSAAGEWEKCLIPLNAALPGIPRYTAPPALAGRIATGVRLSATDFDRPPETDAKGCFQVVDGDGRLLAVMDRQADSYRYRCVMAG